MKWVRTVHFRTLRKNCLYQEFFWSGSVFPNIRTEYGEIRSMSPYLVQMQKNTDTFQAVAMITDITMGTKCAPSYAIISMVIFDTYTGA